MYRVDEFLSPEERLAAMHHGMIVKLGSMGIGPGEFVRMVKRAQARGSDVESLIKSMAMLSVGLGIPAGVAWYAASRALKPSTSTNRGLKRKLHAYNKVIAQYGGRKKQVQAPAVSGSDEEEDGDQPDRDSVDVASSQSGSFPWQTEKAASVGAGLAGGLLAGGSSAALAALISTYLEARRQKKEEEEDLKDKVSPDTVVLYVGGKGGKASKTAEDKSVGEDGRVSVKVVPTEESSELLVGHSGQPRELDGRFSGSLDKKAIARAVNNGVMLASLVAAAPAGYVAVKKLADKLEENRLKDQVEAAQKEYIDLLSGSPVEKDAEEFLDVIGVPKEGMSKSAGLFSATLGGVGSLMDASSKHNASFRRIEDLGSVGVASALLSSLAAAYITNKAMHKHYDPKEDPEDEDSAPEVRHVVYRRAPEQLEKPAEAREAPLRIMFKCADGEFEITPGQALATISVLRECIRDSAPIEKSAQAMPSYSVDQIRDLFNGKSLMGIGWEGMDAYARHYGFRNADELVNWMATAKPDQKLNGSGIYASRTAGEMLDDISRQTRGRVTPEQLKRIMTPAYMRTLRVASEGRGKGYNDLFGEGGISGQSMADLMKAISPGMYGFGSGGVEAFLQAHPEDAGKLVALAGSTDPAKIKAALMEQVRADPMGWMKRIGSDEFSGFRDAAVNNWMQSNPTFGWLSRIPVIGNLVQAIGRWYAGTEGGRRRFINNFMTQAGFNQQDASNMAQAAQFYPGSSGWGIYGAEDEVPDANVAGAAAQGAGQAAGSGGQGAAASAKPANPAAPAFSADTDVSVKPGAHSLDNAWYRGSAGTGGYVFDAYGASQGPDAVVERLASGLPVYRPVRHSSGRMLLRALSPEERVSFKNDYLKYKRLPTAAPAANPPAAPAAAPPSNPQNVPPGGNP